MRAIILYVLLLFSIRSGAQPLELADLMRLTVTSPAELKPELTQRGFEARISGDLSEQFYVKQGEHPTRFEQIEYHEQVNVLTASGEVLVRDHPELYYFFRDESVFIALKNEVALLIQSGKLDQFGTAPDLLYF